MPAGRPRQFDKEAALDRALELFWRHGYEGASMGELERAMGISRPSLYAAFGGKEALFRAAVDRYVQGPGAFVGRALAEPRVADAVRRLLFDAAEELTAPGHPPGCLAVHGALSCGAEGAVARDVLAAQRAASQEAIAERLARAVAEGELPPGTDPGRLARYLAALFQGMAVQAASGAARDELLTVAEIGLEAWGMRSGADVG